MELLVMIVKIVGTIVLLGLVAFVGWQHYQRIKRREERLEPAPPKRTPCQYNVRLDTPRGAFIIGAGAELGKIVLGGWTIDGRWADGDYLLIFRGAEGQHTRYRIDRLQIHGPSGFWSAECTFSPRGAIMAVRAD